MKALGLLALLLLCGCESSGRAANFPVQTIDGKGQVRVYRFHDPAGVSCWIAREMAGDGLGIQCFPDYMLDGGTP